MLMRCGQAVASSEARTMQHRLLSPFLLFFFYPERSLYISYPAWGDRTPKPAVLSLRRSGGFGAEPTAASALPVRLGVLRIMKLDRLSSSTPYDPSAKEVLWSEGRGSQGTPYSERREPAPITGARQADNSIGPHFGLVSELILGAFTPYLGRYLRLRTLFAAVRAMLRVTDAITYEYS